MRLIRDGEPRTATSAFTQLRNSALSAWLLVALTAQRAASVVWPHRVSVICTRHKSVVTIIVLSCVACLALTRYRNGTADRCTLRSLAYRDLFVSVWVKVNTLWSRPLCFLVCVQVG